MFGDENVTREILKNVPDWLATTFYALAAASCLAAAWAFWHRRRSYGKSRRVDVQRPAPSWPIRLGRAARYLAFHEQIRRDPAAGWAHLLTVYGFTVLFIGTCLVFLEHDTPLHFFYGWFYQVASFAIDLGGVAFIVGLSMFLWRRATNSSDRILRAWWVTALSVLLLMIGISGFLLEAARIAIDFPRHEWVSFVGYALALGLSALGVTGHTAVRLSQWLWASHALLCIGFFALLPWGFFSHMVYGIASATDRREAPLSRLAVWPLEGDLSPGAATWMDFTPRDLLQSDACTTCGRCNEACPAAATGKPLRPRDVVLALRDNQTHSPLGALPIELDDDVLWSCTTCAACNQACPVEIDVYGKIVALRRGRVESGAVPAAAEDVFESTAKLNNPFGRSDADRMNWAHGLDVPIAEPGEPIDLLYWVGCAGSFSPEGQTIARSMVKILNHLGVNYRMLGTAERCTGDPARRMGEEGLFRRCAARNVATLRSHGVRRLLTNCPHCFNTFRNEYPALDSTKNFDNLVTQHHTEFLAEQIAAGRLNGSSRLSESVTFHDPCYLGRGNGVIAPPRSVLHGLELPVFEMPRSGEQSFCCGAGGGAMWLDVRGRERVEDQRYEEASETGARIIGTGCPFCKTMLDAARQSAHTESGASPRVMDLAELVVVAEGL